MTLPAAHAQFRAHVETGFRFRRVGDRRQACDFPRNAMDIGFEPSFFGCSTAAIASPTLR